jgi:hypothetical protein
MIIIAALTLILATQAAQAGFTTWLPSPREPNLDEILDNLYGLSNLQRVEDEGIGETDQLWNNLGGEVHARARFALTRQIFGYFVGPSGEDFEVLFTARDDGYISWLSASFSPSETGSVFRFADRPRTDRIWSSRPSDHLGGMDQMVTYRITGNDGSPENQIGNYVLAWEDESWLGDRDYNDLVVEVSGVSPVPEPATLALFGMGLAGFVSWRVKRRKK